MNRRRNSYNSRNSCRSLGDDLEMNSRKRLSNYIKYLPADKIERLARKAERFGVRVVWYSSARDTARSLIWQTTKYGLVDLISKEIKCCRDHRRQMNHG